MDDAQSPPIRTFFPLALMLAVPGCIWLIYLITSTLPNLENRWMFFVAAVLAVTGITLPVVAYLNRIIKPFGTATFEMVVRESTMIGAYAGILLWLNKGQVLTLGFAFILAVGFIFVELTLRLRNRSQWHPQE